MTKRIFRAIAIVAVSVLFASMFLAMGILYDYFSRSEQAQLKTQTALAAQGVETQGLSFFDGLRLSDVRVTWVAPDGTVLYDTEADTAHMENHKDREEIILAQKDGYGESTRYSSTLLERQLYTAQRLSDGSIVRLACSQYTIVTLILGILQPMLAVVTLAAIFSIMLASRVSKRIVEPLNRLNLDEALSNDCYDELSPLLRRINLHQLEIRRQTAALSRARNEFKAVTDGMSEGLLLLNQKSDILSINRSAQRLLNAAPDCVGNNLLTVKRSLAMQDVVRSALLGQRAETVLTLGGGKYQLDASPVFSDGAVTGAVLLMFDVTQRVNAEQMRQEFTANVSHELKTPLHSIFGCAELLQQGMVKPEDVGRFSEQIYTEAKRMIHLLDDIIRLSRLDEGGDDLRRESVDLFSIAGETVGALLTAAQKVGVTLTLQGEPAPLSGMAQLLSSIVFNLCDNAVKYNRPAGSVAVTVQNEEHAVVLTVADTGIGIPLEHQARVFERFYRVDKGRSKQIGGTGLGLSIVKHAALLHKAQIDLQSEPGIGSTFTVRFPK